MSIQLKPEQEQRIADALRSGAYDSEDQVIDRALDVLREQDEWLSAHRIEIDENIRIGIAEMERGEGVPRSHCKLSQFSTGGAMWRSC
jgi:Arc/MetJ-type ribon-helix-helix transcriptional regulator